MLPTGTVVLTVCNGQVMVMLTYASAVGHASSAGACTYPSPGGAELGQSASARPVAGALLRGDGYAGGARAARH